MKVLSTSAVEVLARARMIANAAFDTFSIHPEALLLSVIQHEAPEGQAPSVAQRFLEAAGGYDKFHAAVVDQLAQNPLEVPEQLAQLNVSNEQFFLTPEAFSIISALPIENPENGTVTARHLFLGTLSAPFPVIQQTLENVGVDPDPYLADLLVELAQNAPDASSLIPQEAAQPEAGGLRKDNSLLEVFGTNLSKKAQAGELPPFVGRREEMNHILDTLRRTGKSNPLLVGAPGVGKTALVEGLAQKIAAGDVPASLKNREVILIDPVRFLAGDNDVATLQLRMKSLAEEAQKKNALLVFDNLGGLLPAGNSLHVTHLLEKAFGEHSSPFLATISQEDYKRFQSEKAISRLFQVQDLKPLSEADTVEALQTRRAKLEAHHGVQLTDDALRTAARDAKNHVRERFLPDSAIDLVDETCSRVARAAEDGSGKSHVDGNDIQATLSDWTGVPPERINPDDLARLQHLEGNLNTRIIEQGEATHALASAIRRARAGLKDPKEPIGSFLFPGPTGAGKTEAARALALELFGDEKAVVRFDMSEYMTDHAATNLIGSPIGYQGADQGGRLTQAVRRKPYSVVLLDEIEKAHPSVYNLLLQVLEDGRLTDNLGTADFSNTVIIMTTNAGVKTRDAAKEPLGFRKEQAAQAKSPEVQAADYEKKKETFLENLKKSGVFPPEFLNRTETVVFNSLSKDAIQQIVPLRLAKLNQLLEAKGLKVELSPEASQFLADKGYDKEYNARPLKRVMKKYLEDPLADQIIDGKLRGPLTIQVGLNEGRLTFDTGAEKTPAGPAQQAPALAWRPPVGELLASGLPGAARVAGPNPVLPTASAEKTAAEPQNQDRTKSDRN
ncbi:MAG: ATP-dependent Clp protease ATP-binding subunit [Verrucomicrobium sp.]|nr:ATP-dependent Clp protease ATP-binding subunit [Verrucomicrobium sp.]